MLTYPPVVLPLDLTDINSLPGHISTVLQIYEHIDIVINNGGISYRGLINETNVDVDIKIMLTNYFGQIALTKGKMMCFSVKLFLANFLWSIIVVQVSLYFNLLDRMLGLKQ